MKGFSYLPGVSTLELDREACVGCGMCEEVCPHQVFAAARRQGRDRRTSTAAWSAAPARRTARRGRYGSTSASAAPPG